MFAKTFKRGLLPPVVAVLLVLATFCEVPVYTDDYEPNDSFEDAKTISLGAIIEANILPEGDVDYFKLNLTGSDSLMLRYTLSVPSQLRPEIRFYISANEELIDHRNYSTELGASLEDSLMLGAGDLVVRVSSFSYEESDSNYTLTLSTSAPVVAATD